MQTTVFVSLMMTTVSSLLRLKPKVISRFSTKSLCVPKSKHEMCNELLLQDTSRISFLVGPAGTGKTYVAVKAGLQSLLDGQVDKIVITKPLISVDNEQLGFLPGSVEKKLTPWMISILNLFKTQQECDSKTVTSNSTPNPFQNQKAQKKSKLSKKLKKMTAQGEPESLLLQVHKKYHYRASYGSQDAEDMALKMMMDSKIIEFAPLGFLRGATIQNAFVIADEMQNSSPIQMKMLLSRLGKGSKMVITGDNDQQDRYDVFSVKINGLEDILIRLSLNADESSGTAINVVRFDKQDIVRDPLISSILYLYEESLFDKPYNQQDLTNSFKEDRLEQQQQQKKKKDLTTLLNEDETEEDEEQTNDDAAMIPKAHMFRATIFDF